MNLSEFHMMKTSVLGLSEPLLWGDNKVSEDLIQSVLQFGVMEPLVVHESEDGLTLIDGHKRLQAAIACRLDEVPVMMFSDLPEARVFLMAVELNRFKRDFSVVEKALIIKRAANYFDPEEIRSILGPLLQVQSEHLFTDLRKISKLSEKVRFLAINREWPLHLLIKISEMLEENDSDVFCSFVNHWPLNQNKLLQCCEWMVDLSRREGGRWTDWLKKVEEQGPKSADELRDILMEWRNPQMTREKKNFESQLRQLKSPVFIRVEPSPAFEKDEITLQIRLNSKGDILKASEWLNSSNLISLFERN